MLTSYLPPSARVCNEHMTAQDWNQLLNEDVSHDFTNDHILYIISVFRTALDKPSPVFNFELDTIDENELRHWTGLTIAEFRMVLEQTPSLLEQSNKPNVVLGGFLMKLRSGEPNERIASLLKISRRTFEWQLVIARECLSSDFVPLHFGVDHIERNEALNKNLLIPKTIFGDPENTKLTCICDETYILNKKVATFCFSATVIVSTNTEII